MAGTIRDPPKGSVANDAPVDSYAATEGSARTEIALLGYYSPGKAANPGRAAAE
jgi:hypothetical protein